MKRYICMLLMMGVQSAQSETCAKLGNIVGSYYQTLEIPEVSSKKDGIASFVMTGKYKYIYSLADSIDKFGTPIGLRSAEINLITVGDQCYFINPIYPQVNTSQKISRVSKDQYIITSLNSGDPRAITVLKRMIRE